MSKSKVAITLEERTLQKLDCLVKDAVFPNRSQAIQEALEEKLNRLEHARLARECSKLDANFEKALAEEGLAEEMQTWPEY